MPLQYIHTSARRGLEPGKSGFCCVARDRDLPIDLEKELERLSRYEHIPGKSSPVILRHILVSVRSGNFHVLSRLSDAGADYSKRNNHIAHHLAFSDDEIVSLPDPATILLYWKNWRNSWGEPPRVLQERDQFKISDLDTSKGILSIDFDSPIKTGTPQDTAFTVEEGQEPDLALHFRNELLSLPASQRWSISFTNFILTSDQPTQFLWRGNWKDRPLPFEFESQTEKTKVINTAQNPEVPLSQDDPEPEPEEDSHRITKSAPKVEIPTELTRADRKRPKLKWTRKRLSNTLNLTLAILAVLCCGTIAFLLLDFSSNQDPGSSPSPQGARPTGSNPPKSSVGKATDPREAWSSLLASGTLYEQIDRGLEIAAQLSERGDSEPLLIAETLATIRTTIRVGDSEQATIIPIPGALVQKTGNQWVLEKTVASAANALGLSLVHESLIPFLKEPLASNPIFDPLRDHIPFDRFIPEDTTLSIKAVNRAARDRLVQNGIDAITAAEEYRELWQTLSVESIHKLETAFDLDPGEGYLAIDDDGLLISPSRTNISAHIKGLYEQFILPRVSSFSTSSEFRDALKAASLDHNTAIDEARSIYQVLVNAKALSKPLEVKLERIRKQWHETFIRDDLMEETIINFNLERLANSKRNLASLQAHFNQKTLADLDFTNQITDAIEIAERSIQAIDSDSSWALHLRNP